MLKTQFTEELEIELYQRAVKNYERWMRQCGDESPAHPSWGLSEVTEDRIILENVRGELCRFKYNRKTDRMRREVVA